MNADGVRVTIFDGERCIYEWNTSPPKENDMETLLRDLRDTHWRLNDFLTTQIERQRDDASGSAQNTADRATSSDVESDSVEEEVEEDAVEEEKTEEERREEEKRVNPKKCKLSM